MGANPVKTVIVSKGIIPASRFKIAHKVIMYLDYYKLKTYPFKTNPDPEFLLV